jgi:hypothetical protein
VVEQGTHKPLVGSSTLPPGIGIILFDARDLPEVNPKMVGLDPKRGGA